jgi:hypothetical protein
VDGRSSETIHADEADPPAAARIPTRSATAAPRDNDDSKQTPSGKPIVRPPLADDPDLPARLELLDNGLAAGADNPDLPAGLELLDDGLAAGPDNPDWLVDPPLLTARLVLPVPQERSRRVFQKRADKVFAQDTVSEWITSATLVLAMFAGATCAALVFHDRLSEVVVRCEAHLR